MAAHTTGSTTSHVQSSLEQFVLCGVTQTGRSLGSGAYGCVEVLSMDGLECAGKRMFPMLVDPRNEGAERVKQKYYKECHLLSSLRHPNIVQFLGVCYLEAQSSASTDNLPSLVMEMLQGSLDDLLENTPNIPLTKKCSILEDVARGLVYLHGHNPVVIHRDLTARNVLLNSALVAKIADMGNSLIVKSDKIATASTVPGTLVYMPPEATSTTKCQCNSSLDIFSFGHLTLFTLTQDFPQLLPPTYKDPKTGRIMGRTEVERRGAHMKILESMLPKSHTIVSLVEECLGYDPSSRPSASNILRRLQGVSASINDPCHTATRLELENSVSALGKQLKDLEPFAIKGLEVMEKELLEELKRTKGAAKREKPQLPQGTAYIESRGLRYDTNVGDIAGNTMNAMIIVSAGDQFPSDVEIEQRVRNTALADKAFKIHGRLPPYVTCLHKEAAADLMATASNELKSLNIDLVSICIDSPSLQRSKTYYLEKITNFFKTSCNPVVSIDYLGHSEKHTGNWCFKDGTISFGEVFSLYTRHCPGKLLTMQSDCCYSGQWVLDCAKTLDLLGIPPCGHRARERGVLLRVFASCQPQQKAVEPGYSMNALSVGDDGIATVQATSFEDQKSAWFSGTKLVCCRGPDTPCPKNTFTQLKWMDGVARSFPINSFTRKEQGRDTWCCFMLKDASQETAEAFEAELKKNSSPKLSKWGYILFDGEGEKVPSDIVEKLLEWTRVTA